MRHIHLIGCASALFDNLSSWRDRVALFEQSTLDCLSSAIERVRTARPEWVVYCGQAAASSWDEFALQSVEEANRVAQVANAAAEAGARLAVVSSDRIFSGPKMFHEETEPAGDDPVAQSYHAIEQAALAVEAIRSRVLVVRTNALGWTIAGDSFAERIFNALDCGRPVELSTTSFATPILASQLGELLLRCLRARLHGVVHISGAERASMFRFAQELAVIAGFDPRLVASDGDPSGKTGGGATDETSLGSRLVRRELDVALPLLRETVGEFIEQAVRGDRDRIRGAGQCATSRAA